MLQNTRVTALTLFDPLREKITPPPLPPRLGLIKRYDEVRKISIGQGDDYTTGCLLDFSYFKNNYRLIAADLSKQNVLDADSRAIQQFIFIGKTS